MMTSEAEAIKTNEFLRRRKLRLQQVREQSKDIAKKIRQRAKVEKLRQVVDLDAKKQKEYFECQEKLVKRLEVLYARGLEKVGAGHHSASELTQQDEVKTDLSKLRGKEAATELRRKRQEKLDQQKKLLDRKLQAREIANEISQAKSSVTANKLSKSVNNKQPDDITQKAGAPSDLIKETNQDAGKNNCESEGIKTSDMATQWDMETIPNEWEPAIPTLALSNEKDSGKDSEDNVVSRSDKIKRLDLFALSNEMPSSLRGKHTLESIEREPGRPSLTLVSEFLQNRKLRLRQTETTNMTKKNSDDMRSLKQTILRTRTNKLEGSPLSVCQVLDEQIIPVPVWRAERNCQYCSHSVYYHSPVPSRHLKSVTNSEIDKIFSSIRPVQHSGMQPSPVLRGSSPFRRSKLGPKTFKSNVSNDKAKFAQDNALNKKSSVLMYNHSTRDTRDLPYGNDKFVVRDLQSEEDAYSQAMKEVSALGVKVKEHKKVQDMRNKIAVTKQNVEKEYKDTMNFLNSLPKDKCSKVIKKAYMDERRQRMENESRQQKMQEEYRKIEKECRKHDCLNKSRSKSKSPTKQDLDDNFENRDFQYSWMPVPESDGNLAIHAIPNTLKQGKSGNSVKFSKVDSYHEYRSRHKHTPPTKDTSQDRLPKKKVIETVIIDKNESETSDTTSITSDTSSVETVKLETRTKGRSVKEINQNLSDAERIIIYKVLDARTDKKTKRQTKLLNEIAKSLTCIEKVQKTVSEDCELPKKQKSRNVRPTTKSADNALSFEQLNEGVYKMVEEQGDNVASMYFMETENVADAQTDNSQTRSCHYRKISNTQQKEEGTALNWESGDCIQPVRTTDERQYPSSTINKENTSKPPPLVQTSAAASNSSFITATNDKGGTSEGGYIRLVDETGQEAGKFFIGATGYLNNNTYEVVIQLRKKDGQEQENKLDDKTASNQNKQSDSELNSKSKEMNPPMSSETDVNDVQRASEDDLQEILEYRSLSDKESKMIPPVGSESDLTNTNVVSEDVMVDKAKTNQSETNTEAGNDIFLIQSTSAKKDMCDKGVHTHLSAPKMEQVARPATTTYTQTSSSSPIHRPVFFHMSSSTSTAYMSPPEMVLPKFLKKDCVTDDEAYDPVHTIEMTNEYCEEYADCACTKCTHARQVTLSTVNMPMYCRKNINSKKTKTPPNSTSNLEVDKNQASDALHERNVNCKTARLYKPKCKHRNSGNVEIVKCRHKNKRPSTENIRSTRNISMHIGMNMASRNRYKTNSSKEKSNLNPIIKDYVNKLLALNREGLKAVEVADQECSSVGTPSSSIINVPCNVDERKPSIGNKISLEQIKNVLKQKIIEEHLIEKYTRNSVVYSVANSRSNIKYSSSRTSRKKPIHKVKSLNISKHLLKKNKKKHGNENKNEKKIEEKKVKKPATPSSTDDNMKKQVTTILMKKSRSKSSPTPRQMHALDQCSKSNDSESTAKISTRKTDELSNRSVKTNNISPESTVNNQSDNIRHCAPQLPSHRATTTTLDSESLSLNLNEETQRYKTKSTIEIASSMSTQTNQNMDMNTDANFMKLAEDKLHNMEKIADLTEKCTKRLSNLAKVLKEVRKNKSLVYSQISSAESTDSHQSALEEVRKNKSLVYSQISSAESTDSHQSDHKSDKLVVTPVQSGPNNIPQRLETTSPDPASDKENTSENERSCTEYNTVLADIPKPLFKEPTPPVTPHVKSADKLDPSLHLYTNSELLIKNRPKPPPALSRLNFKNEHDYVVPHELSTVIEVDSPMSMKHRSQSARNDAKEVSINSNRSSPGDHKDYEKSKTIKELSVNPDLLQTNTKYSKKYKSSDQSSDDSKFQMIDLKQFNEIMLEPFVSIQEYAKQYNMEPPDEGSNLDDIIQREGINDDISSLHSDGSLPDVIAELLKRNIITEPFKFDTASNINSTTISSESTLSMLALSKARKNRKRATAVFHNKENIGETSDTLSISSNPDLEHAFKKLGMGWASSTLKKTKERLALSSSSNTSSSSLSQSQFKIKSFNQDIPVLITDSVSSIVNVMKGMNNQNSIDNSKTVEQQTNLSNSMTVKEFLRNELAKKITFHNKSNVNDPEEEFISLFDTKMPEEMKDTSQVTRDERSVDSAPSGGNRARTSTPVQIFKSMTYHSSSSSNVSNSLFSNADDLSSVKMTSNSMKNHSTSDKDDLTIPNFSLRMKKGSDCSKSD